MSDILTDLSRMAETAEQVTQALARAHMAASAVAAKKIELAMGMVALEQQSALRDAMLARIDGQKQEIQAQLRRRGKAVLPATLRASLRIKLKALEAREAAILADADQSAAVIDATLAPAPALDPADEPAGPLFERKVLPAGRNGRA
jgi:hypothetical protein